MLTRIPGHLWQEGDLGCILQTTTRKSEQEYNKFPSLHSTMSMLVLNLEPPCCRHGSTVLFIRYYTRAESSYPAQGVAVVKLVHLAMHQHTAMGYDGEFATFSSLDDTEQL